MYFHRSIFRSHCLGFVAKQKNPRSGKNSRCFLRYNSLTLHQNPFRRFAVRAPGFLQDRFSITRCNHALVLRNKRKTNKPLQVHLVNGFSVIQEMIRSIHMCAVMGAHPESCQVAYSTFRNPQHHLSFRHRIPGVHAAGKHFLGNIVYFHASP